VFLAVVECRFGLPDEINDLEKESKMEELRMRMKDYNFQNENKIENKG
jgi:hypothetical protein